MHITMLNTLPIYIPGNQNFLNLRVYLHTHVHFIEMIKKDVTYVKPVSFPTFIFKSLIFCKIDYYIWSKQRIS